MKLTIIHSLNTKVMRFSEIRKTGKRVLVNMCRRRRVNYINDYGLETFKVTASQHWVEGVVISRQKGIKKHSSHVTVAVNQSLIEAAASCDDVKSVLQNYMENIDYKDLSFYSGRDNDYILKIGADIYWSGIGDGQIMLAIKQEKGVVSLLRKDVEDWTDADLHRFYSYFMVPYLGYPQICYWTRFDEIGFQAANVMIQARHLCGITGLASGWNETPERYNERLDRDWSNNNHIIRMRMESEMTKGYAEGKPLAELRQTFEKYCVHKDANKGASVEDILRRRNSMAFCVTFSLRYTERDTPKGKAMSKFYEDIAANPDEDARSRFVIYQKPWT